MKKLVVLGLIALFGVQAQALTLDNGPVTFHLRDGSSLYRQLEPDTAYVPLPPLSPTALIPPEIGDENRAVFQIDQSIQTVTQSLPEGTLTGLFYGTVVGRVFTSVDPVSGHTYFDLYYVASDRNPLDTSNFPDVPAGSGGAVELWADATPENNQADPNLLYDELDPQSVGGVPTGTAPLLWQEGGHSSGRDAFPNVNLTTDGSADEDATLWLQAVLVPLGTFVDGTPYLLHERIDTWTGSGTYDPAFLDIIGGSANAAFVRDTYGIGRDLELQLTVQGPGLNGLPNSYNTAPDNAAQRGGWQVRSSDPVTGEILPEPATMSLFGLGFAAMAMIRRRRAK